jgi:hypothetical protein
MKAIIVAMLISVVLVVGGWMIATHFMERAMRSSGMMTVVTPYLAP